MNKIINLKSRGSSSYTVLYTTLIFQIGMGRIISRGRNNFVGLKLMYRV